MKRQPKLANHNQTPQENKGEDSNLKKIINEKREVTTDNVDTKGHERLLWANILQQNGQTGRNAQVPRKVQPSKTEPGKKNRNHEWTNHKHWYQNCD